MVKSNVFVRCRSVGVGIQLMILWSHSGSTYTHNTHRIILSTITPITPTYTYLDHTIVNVCLLQILFTCIRYKSGFTLSVSLLSSVCHTRQICRPIASRITNITVPLTYPQTESSTASHRSVFFVCSGFSVETAVVVMNSPLYPLTPPHHHLCMGH